jgi:hypothetical protein
MGSLTGAVALIMEPYFGNRISKSGYMLEHLSNSSFFLTISPSRAIYTSLCQKSKQFWHSKSYLKSELIGVMSNLIMNMSKEFRLLYKSRETVSNAGNQQETNHLLHFYVIFVVGSSTTIRQTSFNFVKG